MRAVILEPDKGHLNGACGRQVYAPLDCFLPPSFHVRVRMTAWDYRRSSIASALETPYSPDGSTLSSLTTPSFTTIE
jgi:hypothetical protein